MRLRVVALTLLMIASAAPLAAQKKVERKLALRMDGSFRIHNMVGSVTVRGWNKDTVMVRATLGAGAQLFMGGSPAGGKMFIESDDERHPQPTTLEVWLPLRARLWVKTATANIDVNGVAGGLDLYVVSGTIDVTGNPRELNAEAIDGDIHVAGSPPWLRAKTATGTIVFRGASADVALSTVSGAVRVEGAKFERMKVETVTGNISFAGPVDRGSFDFDSHGGTVDIAIPDRTNAGFNVATIAGRIDNRLSKAKPVAGRFGRGQELAFEDGAGGAMVSVRTFKGPVTLRRTP